MNSNASDFREPTAKNYFEKFSEPQTIPPGWEVASFFCSQREIEEKYGTERHADKNMPFNA